MTKKDKTSTIFMYSLGGIICIGFFTILYLLINNEVATNNKEVLYIMLGALVASFTGVVQYFYGSSAGSKQKTDIMDERHKVEAKEDRKNELT